MRKEKWIQICQIQGFEDVREWYWISNSNEDKIINRNTKKQLKILIDNYGYPRVDLRIIGNGKRTCRIHVIKAKAFLYNPNPLIYNVIRHLNDIKIDNRLENLAWGTQLDNAGDCMRNGHYNYEASARGIAIGSVMGGAITGAKNGKRTSKPIKCIETGIIYPSACEASRQLNIDRANINHCCHGKQHTAGGFHFEFVNKEVNKNELECE